MNTIQQTRTYASLIVAMVDTLALTVESVVRPPVESVEKPPVAEALTVTPAEKTEFRVIVKIDDRRFSRVGLLWPPNDSYVSAFSSLM